MSIISRMKVEKPEDIEMTATITMKAKDWEKLREQLTANSATYGWPGSDLVYAINDLLGQARKVFWSEGKKE